MGIINHSEYVLSNGINLRDTYICISSNQIRISKLANGNYSVVVNYLVYCNQEAKLNDKNPLSNVSFEFIISESQLSSNLYTLGYRELKIMYPNYSDSV